MTWSEAQLFWWWEMEMRIDVLVGTSMARSGQRTGRNELETCHRADGGGWKRLVATVGTNYI